MNDVIRKLKNSLEVYIKKSKNMMVHLTKGREALRKSKESLKNYRKNIHYRIYSVPMYEAAGFE